MSAPGWPGGGNRLRQHRAVDKLHGDQVHGSAIALGLFDRMHTDDIGMIESLWSPAWSPLFHRAVRNRSRTAYDARQRGHVFVAVALSDQPVFHAGYVRRDWQR